MHEDSIRKYETEGTPVNISHAGSAGNLSDLSIPGEKSPKTPSRMGKVKPGSIPSSDNSSICDDSDGILAQCIQSAMPKVFYCISYLNRVVSYHAQCLFDPSAAFP